MKPKLVAYPSPAPGTPVLQSSSACGTWSTGSKGHGTPCSWHGEPGPPDTDLGYNRSTWSQNAYNTKMMCTPRVIVRYDIGML